LRAQEESLKTRVEELEGLAEQQREKSRRQRSEAESFQEDIAEFAEAQDQLSKAQASILVLDDREKELHELQAALRDRHGEVLRRINELFVFVSRSLLGTTSKLQSTSLTNDCRRAFRLVDKQWNP
jgi:DNA repair exonuclease SbcCD ATPase subunit